MNEEISKHEAALKKATKDAFRRGMDLNRTLEFGERLASELQLSPARKDKLLKTLCSGNIEAVQQIMLHQLAPAPSSGSPYVQDYAAATYAITFLGEAAPPNAVASIPAYDLREMRFRKRALVKEMIHCKTVGSLAPRDFRTPEEREYWLEEIAFVYAELHTKLADPATIAGAVRSYLGPRAKSIPAKELDRLARLAAQGDQDEVRNTLIVRRELEGPTGELAVHHSLAQWPDGPAEQKGQRVVSLETVKRAAVETWRAAWLIGTDDPAFALMAPPEVI